MSKKIGDRLIFRAFLLSQADGCIIQTEKYYDMQINFSTIGRCLNRMISYMWDGQVKVTPEYAGTGSPTHSASSSSDIPTEFQGRSDEIRVHPLSVRHDIRKRWYDDKGNIRIVDFLLDDSVV